MKAYSAVELQSILDDEIVWRRREMTTLINTMQDVSYIEQRALIRASVPLLYAHWEGFGKACGTRYLEHVSYKAKRFKNLKMSFSYLAFVPSLSGLAEKAPQVAIQLLHEMSLNQERINRNTFRKRVNTKSNLRFDVLTDMLTICGIDVAPFKEYESFIDLEICDQRNEIAHGSGAAPNFEVLRVRRNRLFAIMTHLKNEFVNAAVLQTYLQK